MGCFQCVWANCKFFLPRCARPQCLGNSLAFYTDAGIRLSHRGCDRFDLTPFSGGLDHEQHHRPLLYFAFAYGYGWHKLAILVLHFPCHLLEPGGGRLFVHCVKYHHRFRLSVRDARLGRWCVQHDFADWQKYGASAGRSDFESGDSSLVDSGQKEPWGLDGGLSRMFLVFVWRKRGQSSCRRLGSAEGGQDWSWTKGLIEVRQ